MRTRSRASALTEYWITCAGIKIVTTAANGDGYGDNTFVKAVDTSFHTTFTSAQDAKLWLAGSAGCTASSCWTMADLVDL